MKDELDLEHALASRLLYTDGAELLVRYAAEDEDLEVARTRQRQLTQTVKDQLQLISYAGDGYAARLQLFGYGPARSPPPCADEANRLSLLLSSSSIGALAGT